MKITLLFSMVILLFIEVNVANSSADFSAILSSKYFVDKTLLIQELFVDEPDETGVKLITAPDGYGKSTVIDMVRRFVSISVDDGGRLIPPASSPGHKLFCDNRLDICRDNSFTKLHLGQHPVIHIDLAPLKGMISFGSMLARLRKVLQTTFLQHKYLTENTSLWLDDLEKNAFTGYYHDERHQELSEYEILYGFDVLSDLLYRQYGRGVIVLVDEFEAYGNSLLFQNILHTEQVKHFYRKLHRNILQKNQFLVRALVTGVQRDADVTMAPHNVDEYVFLRNHKFFKYYGFGEPDIDMLLKRNIASEETRNVVQASIESKCDSHVIERISRKVYSISSVIRFFKKNVEN